jgi:hypothetical protein
MRKGIGGEAVVDEDVDGRSLLDEIAREGARRMPLVALETEVATYLESHATEHDTNGHALVVRNGKGRTRHVTLGSGTIAVNAPRVNDRRIDADGRRCKFTSRILPPYMRRSPIGVRPDGTKELIAVEDGYRESAESWKTVLRDLRRRGMRPPVVAVGDGALGFWAAVRDVWPKTREQRDWFHKLGNILDKLPRRLQHRVKAGLHEVMYAETREQAREAITRFRSEYGAKYPKAVTTLEKDADAVLTFFDFPAEHWKHLRTSNMIESPFATVRLRQRVTKGAGSRTKGLLMAYKLLEMAQARWRRLDGAHLLPLVRAGITFIDGVQHTIKERSRRFRSALPVRRTSGSSSRRDRRPAHPGSFPIRRAAENSRPPSGSARSAST